MSDAETVDQAAVGTSGTDEKRQRHKLANRLIYMALGILLLGLLDPINARLLCVGNSGITALRMVCLASSVTLALASVWFMIPGKRWRIYWGILAFFVWMVVVMQPFYYVHLRSNVGGASCVWTGKTIHPRARTS